jgi:hypothetical protein
MAADKEKEAANSCATPRRKEAKGPSVNRNEKQED